MPKICLYGVAMLLLSGCQQAANEAAPAENAVSASNASAAPTEVNAAGNGQEQNFIWVVEPVNLIPPSFVGVYDRDAAACSSAGSEDRLTVDLTELRFHESIGEARVVSAESDRTISVEADFQGEGESWHNRLRLSLGAGGTLTVTQPDGSSLTRIRCP